VSHLRSALASNLAIGRRNCDTNFSTKGKELRRVGAKLHVQHHVVQTNLRSCPFFNLTSSVVGSKLHFTSPPHLSPASSPLRSHTPIVIVLLPLDNKLSNSEPLLNVSGTALSPTIRHRFGESSGIRAKDTLRFDDERAIVRP
jgi:hypothetical protein